MKKRCVWFAVTILVLCLVPAMSFGQAVFGSIFGTVTDPQGAAIQNATVTVTDVARERPIPQLPMIRETTPLPT